MDGRRRGFFRRTASRFGFFFWSVYLPISPDSLGTIVTNRPTFSDPSLMEALPDTIPDFFLVTPRNITIGNPADLQQAQQFQSLTLDPAAQQQQQQQPGPSPSSNLLPTPGGDRSHPPSPPSDSSPHAPGETSSRAGAGRSAGRRAEEDPDAVLKRQRNTIAARKYRQKRLDRIKELEDALEEVTRDRDELRLKLARQEAETAALKEMMHMKNKAGP